jgi:hypothetical protein
MPPRAHRNPSLCSHVARAALRTRARSSALVFALFSAPPAPQRADARPNASDTHHFPFPLKPAVSARTTPRRTELAHNKSLVNSYQHRGRRAPTLRPPCVRAAVAVFVLVPPPQTASALRRAETSRAAPALTSPSAPQVQRQRYLNKHCPRGPILPPSFPSSYARRRSRAAHIQTPTHTQ